MIGDAGEDIGEPSLRVDVVEPCRLDQRVGDRGALATAIRAAEEPRFTPERYTTQRPFRGFAREADSAIVEEAGERAPAVSIGVQKGPPIGVQKGPRLSSGVTGMAGVPFALVAA